MHEKLIFQKVIPFATISDFKGRRSAKKLVDWWCIIRLTSSAFLEHVLRFALHWQGQLFVLAFPEQFLNRIEEKICLINFSFNDAYQHFEKSCSTFFTNSENSLDWRICSCESKEKKRKSKRSAKTTAPPKREQKKEAPFDSSKCLLKNDWRHLKYQRMFFPSRQKEGCARRTIFWKWQWSSGFYIHHQKSIPSWGSMHDTMLSSASVTLHPQACSQSDVQLQSVVNE